MPKVGGKQKSSLVPFKRAWCIDSAGKSPDHRVRPGAHQHSRGGALFGAASACCEPETIGSKQAEFDLLRNEMDVGWGRLPGVPGAARAARPNKRAAHGAANNIFLALSLRPQQRPWDHGRVRCCFQSHRAWERDGKEDLCLLQPEPCRALGNG